MKQRPRLPLFKAVKKYFDKEAAPGLQDIPVLGILKFEPLSELIRPEAPIERSLLINLADYSTESTRRLRAILEFLVDIQQWANSRGKRSRHRQVICDLCYRWIPVESGRFCHIHNPLPPTERKKSGAEYVRARRMIFRIAKEYCDPEDWFPNFHFMARVLGEAWEIPSLCPVREWNQGSKIILMEACGAHFRKAFQIIEPSFLQLETGRWELFIQDLFQRLDIQDQDGEYWLNKEGPNAGGDAVWGLLRKYEIWLRAEKRFSGKRIHVRGQVFLDELQKCLQEDPRPSQREIARRLGVTQPAIHKAIKKMERSYSTSRVS